MSKTALITGITGQDGSYLAELLLAKGYTVYGLIRRLSTPNSERIQHILADIHLLTGDLLDQSSLSLVLDKSQPDEIYNLAAQSHVGESFKQPVATGEYNGLGVVRLLEALRLSGGHACFYQASTSELFGNAKEYPQNESTPFVPQSPYATAKLYGHESVRLYRRAYNLHASCGILFNHESPRRGLDFVTRKITSGVARIRAGLQTGIILGNLNACRDWGFAGDYVEAMWLMLQQETPDDYVIATGEWHTIGEFASRACELAGLTKHWMQYVESSEEFMRPSEVYALRGSTTKARRVLGWQPRTTFEQLVEMMVEADMKEIEHESIHLGRVHAQGFSRQG